MKKEIITLTVNGTLHEISVEPQVTLNEVLREQLDLTGTKLSCGAGECGACTVLIDGEPELSCCTLAITANGKDILTVEGLAKDGELHPLQKAFVECGAIQCGFCIPGMLLTSKALLDENSDPTREEVKSYLSGNLCRCTGYVKIVDAVLAAATEMNKGGK